MSEPVMWTTIKGKEGLVPLYTHPAPDDTALLRQALDCLENHVMQRTYASGVVICNTAIALRERLGEKT
jgi:hypothetical protein